MHEITRKPNKNPLNYSYIVPNPYKSKFKICSEKHMNLWHCSIFPNPPHHITKSTETHRHNFREPTSNTLAKSSTNLYQHLRVQTKSAKRQILANWNKKQIKKSSKRRSLISEYKPLQPISHLNSATKSLTNEVPEAFANTSQIQLLRNLRESVRKEWEVFWMNLWSKNLCDVISDYGEVWKMIKRRKENCDSQLKGWITRAK